MPNPAIDNPSFERRAVIVTKKEMEARAFNADVERVLNRFLAKEIDEFEARRMLGGLERVAAKHRGDLDPTDQDPSLSEPFHPFPGYADDVIDDSRNHGVGFISTRGCF